LEGEISWVHTWAKGHRPHLCILKSKLFGQVVDDEIGRQHNLAGTCDNTSGYQNSGFEGQKGEPQNLTPKTYCPVQSV
jgi:hypothetical protein